MIEMLVKEAIEMQEITKLEGNFIFIAFQYSNLFFFSEYVSYQSDQMIDLYFSGYFICIYSLEKQLSTRFFIAIDDDNNNEEVILQRNK
jgi:hypothetical protein